MIYVAAVLLGLALYCGWTGAAWTVNGPIRSSEDSMSFWGFVLSYLAGALVFALGGLSRGNSYFAAFLVCLVLVELWSGIQLGKYRIIYFRDNPGGFFAGTTLWPILALVPGAVRVFAVDSTFVRGKRMMVSNRRLLCQTRCSVRGSFSFRQSYHFRWASIDDPPDDARSLP